MAATFQDWFTEAICHEEKVPGWQFESRNPAVAHATPPLAFNSAQPTPTSPRWLLAGLELCVLFDLHYVSVQVCDLSSNSLSSLPVSSA